MKKKYYNMQSWLSFLVVIFLSFSCNSVKNSNEKSELQEASLPEKNIINSKKILIDINTVKSMKLTFSHTNQTLLITQEDQKKISDIIKTANYDVSWNERAPLIKIKAPDYSIEIEYVKEDYESSKYLMIWKDSGRIRLESWYLLPDIEENKNIYKLLESYRDRIQ